MIQSYGNLLLNWILYNDQRTMHMAIMLIQVTN